MSGAPTPETAATAAGRAALDRLWAAGRRLLGCRYAIMGGAMTWVSERNLVAAISNAGGFGVIACGAMEPDWLREEIEATRALTDRPFGVNLIIMHPGLDALIDVCLASGVGQSCSRAACRAAPRWNASRPAAPGCSASRRASASPVSWCDSGPTG